MTPFLAWDAICKASCHWWALEQLFADALPKVSKENTKQKNIKKHAMRTKSKHQVLTTFSSQCLKHTNIPKYLQLLNLCFEPWDHHHVGKMPSKKGGLSPISFAGVEYGLCGMGGWSAVGYEGSLSRFGSGFSSHIGWIVRSVTHRNAVMGAFSASPYEIRLVLARSVVTHRRKSEDNIKHIWMLQ